MSNSSSLITHLRHIDVAMPNFAEQRQFYTELWGLTETAGDTGVSFLAAEGSPEQYVVRLREDAHKRTDPQPPAERSKPVGGASLPLTQALPQLMDVTPRRAPYVDTAAAGATARDGALPPVSGLRCHGKRAGYRTRLTGKNCPRRTE